METTHQILEKLATIEKMLAEQALAVKSIFTFQEACLFLNVSTSHLYKLTSGMQIPHFCPNGKILYFKKEELENWMLQNRRFTKSEIAEKAAAYVTLNRRRA